MNLFNTNEAIATTINGVKKYKSEYSHLTFFEAFNTVVINLYHYTNGHEDDVCSKSEYVEMFYAAIMGEIELSKVYRCAISNYYSFNPVPIDTKALMELRELIAERRQYLNSLDEKTAEIRRILGHQAFDEAAKKVFPLCKWHKENAENEDINIFYINLFNCGYIEGKRAERKRRHAQIQTPQLH